MTEEHPMYILQQGKEIDEQLLLVASNQVFKKPTVVAGFTVIMVTIFTAFLLMYISIHSLTSDSNDILKSQLSDRDETIAQQEIIIKKSTDAIILLFAVLRQNGIEPPEITITADPDEPIVPTTTTVGG